MRRISSRCSDVAELQAFAPGIYPRSEALVQATRDLDRGRTTPEAVEKAKQLAGDEDQQEETESELPEDAREPEPAAA